jgi:hypothetical protein
MEHLFCADLTAGFFSPSGVLERGLVWDLTPEK